MKDRKFVAYYRVSTARQGRSGLGLDAQKQSVVNFVAGERSSLIGEYTEIESGKRSDRPELLKALSACRIHGATLVIAKLDRLARRVDFIANLLESGVEFVATDMPSANKLTIHIMASMAQYEREAISSRTKAALAQAKARGIELDGDRGNIEKIASAGGKASGVARREAAIARARDILPLIDAIKQSGVTTLSGIAAELTAMGVSTKSGAAWHPQQVTRIQKFVSA